MWPPPVPGASHCRSDLPKGDELWLYYAGTPRAHGARPEGTSEADFARRTGVFRASLRRDGFLSADAGSAGGEFTTPLLTFAGESLLLNCDGSAGGWLQVEVLDEHGQPVLGHTLGDADGMRGNGLEKVVTWKGRADICALEERPVRLRFVMRGMKLYAFQFVNRG